MAAGVTRTAQGGDSRNIFFAIAQSGVPIMNSARSITMVLERPSMHAALKKVLLCMALMHH